MAYEKSTILSDLKSNILEVTFIKADGSQRVMHCTLDPMYLPRNTDLDHLDKMHAEKKNKDVIVAWEVREGHWRSFKASSVRYIQESTSAGG